MSESAQTSAATIAVLLLDEGGRVSAANEAARALWHFAEGDVPGVAFAALFAFEVVSSDPEMLAVQWDALLASALGRTLTLSAQPRGDEAPAARDVRVRLEKISSPGVPGGYLATAEPPAPRVAAAGDDDLAAGFRLLAEGGAAGFFDLNLTAGRVHFLQPGKNFSATPAPSSPTRSIPGARSSTPMIPPPHLIAWEKNTQPAPARSTPNSA